MVERKPKDFTATVKGNLNLTPTRLKTLWGILGRDSINETKLEIETDDLKAEAPEELTPASTGSDELPYLRLIRDDGISQYVFVTVRPGTAEIYVPGRAGLHLVEVGREIEAQFNNWAKEFSRGQWLALATVAAVGGGLFSAVFILLPSLVPPSWNVNLVTQIALFGVPYYALMRMNVFILKATTPNPFTFQRGSKWTRSEVIALLTFLFTAAGIMWGIAAS